MKIILYFRGISPLPSGLNIKLSKKQAWSRQEAILRLSSGMWWVLTSSAMKMESIGSSKMLESVYQTTWHHISEYCNNDHKNRNNIMKLQAESLLGRQNMWIQIIILQGFIIIFKGRQIHSSLPYGTTHRKLGRGIRKRTHSNNELFI